MGPLALLPLGLTKGSRAGIEFPLSASGGQEPSPCLSSLPSWAPLSRGLRMEQGARWESPHVASF